MKKTSASKKSFTRYCQNVSQNINFAFVNSGSACNKFYLSLSDIHEQRCLQCGFELTEKEIFVVKNLVLTLDVFVVSDKKKPDLNATNKPEYIYKSMCTPKANFQLLEELVEQLLFLSVEQQLIGRKNLHNWLNDFYQDMKQNGFFYECDMLQLAVKNMAISIHDFLSHG